MHKKMLTGISGHKNAQGFSLIEVLIAMAIFAIGILAVTSMQMRSINLNTSARLQTEASTLAVDWMERLLAKPFEDICLDEGYFDEDSFNDQDIAPVEAGIDYPHDCEDEAARFLEAHGSDYTIKWMAKDSGKGLPMKEIKIQVNHAHRHAKAVNLSSFKGHDEELPES